jgi:hypothetical protein
VKFKKEDLGLYFALGLVGAGAGLLVGVIISQRLAGPEPIFIPDLDENDFLDDEYEKTARKIARNEKSEEKSDFREINEEAYKEEKAAMIKFIDDYSPTSIELAMLDKGMTTVDELKMAIEQRTGVEDAEPTNYHGAYHVGDLDEDKPELEDLVPLPDEIEVIDERWEISSTMTPDKSRNNLRTIVWDSRADKFLTQSRSGDYVRMNGLENTITPEVWNAVAPFLLAEMGPVFVNDKLSPKHYVFDGLSEEAEVSSTPSSASS